MSLYDTLIPDNCRATVSGRKGTVTQHVRYNRMLVGTRHEWQQVSNTVNNPSSHRLDKGQYMVLRSLCFEKIWALYDCRTSRSHASYTSSREAAQSATLRDHWITQKSPHDAKESRVPHLSDLANLQRRLTDFGSGEEPLAREEAERLYCDDHVATCILQSSIPLLYGFQNSHIVQCRKVGRAL
jgi:hypothetical protein